MGLRIFFLSPPAWVNSGYGRQCFHTVKQLQELPDVDFVVVGSTASLTQGCITYDGISHVPCPETVFGGLDIPRRHMRSLGCNLMITLFDVWPFNRDFGKEWPWVPIVPIDSYPMSRNNREVLQNAYRMIAMSQFGAQVLEDGGFMPESITHIPHMIDLSVYRPLPDKPKLKQQLGFPADAFLIGMVARTTKTNPVNRKGFAEGFDAVTRLMDAHPNVHMYVHAPVYLGEDSADLAGLADIFGMSWDRVRSLDAYAEMMGIPDNKMAEIYGAFDVYLAPSAGEGFNVPLIEAQACGVPVVANDATAQSENVSPKAGWLVPPKTTIVTPLNTQWYLADPIGLYEALEEAYAALQNKDERKRIERETRKFAQQYDIGSVTNRCWRPWLHMVGEELGVLSAEPEAVPEALTPSEPKPQLAIVS